MPDRPGVPLTTLLDRVRSEPPGAAVPVRPDLGDVHARGRRARRRRRTAVAAAPVLAATVAFLAVPGLRGGSAPDAPDAPRLLGAADLGQGATTDPVLDTPDSTLTIPSCAGTADQPTLDVSADVARGFGARSPDGTSWQVQESVYTDHDPTSSEQVLQALSRCTVSDGVLLTGTLPGDDVTAGAVVAAGDRTVITAYRWPDSTLAQVTSLTYRDGRWLQVRARATTGHGSTDPVLATRWFIFLSRTAVERLTGHLPAALPLRSGSFRPASTSVAKQLLQPSDLGPHGEWRLAPPEYRDQAITYPLQGISTSLPTACRDVATQDREPAPQDVGTGVVQGYHARLANGTWGWTLFEGVTTVPEGTRPRIQAALVAASCTGKEPVLVPGGTTVVRTERNQYQAWVLKGSTLVFVSSSVSVGRGVSSEAQPRGVDWFRQVVTTAVTRATT